MAPSTEINAAGQVAGSYNDASPPAHGFIYAGGGYASGGADGPNAAGFDIDVSQQQLRRNTLR
jgi:hypothetical protein